MIFPQKKKRAKRTLSRPKVEEQNMVSLIERITTEQGINHGTICKLKIDGMDSGVKGN